MPHQNGIDRETAYKTAVEMLQREHNRWIQNAVYLFGFLAGIFTLQSKISEYFPLWLAYLLAVLVALITTVVALTIRASTDAWIDTVKKIEASEKVGGNTFRPFHAFYCYYRSRIGRENMKCEIRSLFFLSSKEHRNTREHFFSVTRWYVRLALIAAVVLGVLFARSLWCPSGAQSASAASLQASPIPHATLAAPGGPGSLGAVRSGHEPPATKLFGPERRFVTSDILTVVIPILTTLLGGLAGGYLGYWGALRVQRIEDQERGKAAARAVLAEMFTNVDRALSAESTRVLHQFLNAAWRQQLPLVAKTLCWADLKKLVNAYDGAERAYENAVEGLRQSNDAERRLIEQPPPTGVEKPHEWIEADRRKIDGWFRVVASDWVGAMRLLRNVAMGCDERSNFDEDLRKIEERLKSAEALGKLD